MHQVRYFLAVARTLNFTRAAEECNVAQPSLTRAIKQLEAELGGDLFRRERPQAIMTDLGQRMFPLLKQCYDSAVNARTLASSIREGDVGSLKLAVSHTVELDLLLPHIAELRKLFKDLQVRLLRGHAEEIVELLKSGDAEIAVAGSMPELWDRLDRWPLFDEGFGLILNRAHRLANRDLVAMGDLAHERFLLRPYCEQHAQLTELLRERGIAADEADQVASDKDLVVLLDANMGVGIVPDSLIAPASLMRAKAEGLDLRRTVYLYGVAGRQRTTVAATLMKLLRAARWDGKKG
jgi:DNA-binding transcriptional LysR family regulator